MIVNIGSIQFNVATLW